MEFIVAYGISRLGRGLMISGAVAILAPLGAAGLLAGANAAGQDDVVITQDVAQPAPPAAHKTQALATLGRANAVAWISAGHISPTP
ncbi:MAG: hypothetical protein WDM91_04220 [Rhizomicrobium sp.]